MNSQPEPGRVQWVPHPQTLEVTVMCANIGFALATISAFTEKPGVNGKQIEEASRRLKETLDILKEFSS